MFVEPFLKGEFVKLINNNGHIATEKTDIQLKAEAFTHFNFAIFEKKACVVDKT